MLFEANYEKSRIYNLTNAEKRIWYNEKKFHGVPLHNIGGCIVLKANVDSQIMELAINDLIQNNDAFRIGFIEVEGEPYQYVKEYEYITLQQKNFSSEDEFTKWHDKFFAESFDLYNDRLYSFVLCKFSYQDYRIVLKMHHIVVDGWSFQLIAEYLTRNYFSILNGESCDNGSKNVSYLQSLEKEEKYLESGSMVRSRQYWLDRFKDTDLSEFALLSKRMEGKRKSFSVSEHKTMQMKAFAKANNIFLQTLVMAAYYIYQNACSGKDDIIVGIPIFNRYGHNEKRIIGMFTSTIAFRFGIDKNRSVMDFLTSMNRAFREDLRNQRYPYNMMIKDLKDEGISVDNLFNVSINYYNLDFEKSFAEWGASIEEFYCGYQFYDLQIVIKEWDNSNSFTLFYDYKINNYSEYQINELHEHLLGIIDYVMANCNDTIAYIPVFSPSDYKKYILGYNSTQFEYPENKTFIELFEECTRKMPDRCAIEYNGKEYTYSQLNKQADWLANYIHNDLKFVNKIIGVCTLHSIESVVAILAVLKSGCTYLPLDDKIPEERLRYIIEDSGLSLILTNFEIKYRLDVPVLDLTKCDLTRCGMCQNFSVQQAEIAYIIYTSGTTGKPKGVMVKQRGLVNYISWAKKVYDVVPEDKFALYTSFAFDLTITSIFTPLICGAAIAVYCDDQNKYVLYRIIEDNRVSIVKLTPAHLKLLSDMDNSNSRITRFIVGGENLKYDIANQIYNGFGGNVRIFNEYGPTETVVGCMIYEFNADVRYGSSVPIGKPADNVQIYLLDQNMRPVLPGEKGEIYIAGDGVAQGYLNNDVLSAQRFIPNQFGKGMMYKTGDIARFIDEDTIEYICRIDDQVKVNGYRIELGEIEECIKKIEGIDEAIVKYILLPNGNKVLCAFYSGDNIEKKHIKSFIKNYLPDYMIPVYYTYVEQFNLTLNGKLDRRALPEINTESFDYSQNVDSDKKDVLIKIITFILDYPEASLNDNFYSIGGDSIKAIQLMSRLSEVGYKVNMKDILSADCLGEIVECIEENNTDIYSIEHCKGRIKNTPIYDWFIENNFSNKNHYLQSVRFEIDKSVSPEMISKALKTIIEVHDGLRLNFREDTGFYYEEKYITASFELNIIEEDNDSETVISELKKSVSLTELPIKVLFIQRKHDADNLLVITAHHVVVDGISWQIIADDLNTALEQIKQKKEIKLVKEFTSLEQWYDSLEKYCEAASAQTEYWRKQTLPYNMMKQWEHVSNNYIAGDNICMQITVNAATLELFEKNFAESSFTIDEVILTALFKVLTDIYGMNEISVVLESHGRESSISNNDLSRTVGWFTAMYPVRFEFSDVSDCLKILDEVHMELKRVPDGGIGYGVLKYMLKKIRDDNSYIRFNYLGSIGSVYENSLIKNVIPDMEKNFGKENKNTCLMDINCIRINGSMVIKFECGESFMNKKMLEELVSDFNTVFTETIDEYSDPRGENVMLSNFTAISLSISDLDGLLE